MTRGVVESESSPPDCSTYFTSLLPRVHAPSPISIHPPLSQTNPAFAKTPVHEDPPPTPAAHIHDLESENAALRRKVQALEREFHGRSPTKSNSQPRRPKATAKPHITERTDLEAGSSDFENMGLGMGSMRLDEEETDDEREVVAVTTAMVTKTTTKTKTPKKKVRKLTTRKWDLGLEIEGSSP